MVYHINISQLFIPCIMRVITAVFQVSEEELSLFKPLNVGYLPSGLRPQLNAEQPAHEIYYLEFTTIPYMAAL